MLEVPLPNALPSWTSLLVADGRPLLALGQANHKGSGLERQQLTFQLDETLLSDAQMQRLAAVDCMRLPQQQAVCAQSADEGITLITLAA